MRDAGPPGAHRRRGRAAHRRPRQDPRPRGAGLGARHHRRAAHLAPRRAGQRAPARRSRPGLDRTEVLAEAPVAEEGRFRVPRILGKSREPSRDGGPRSPRPRPSPGERRAIDVLEEHLARIARAKTRSTPSTRCSTTTRAPRPTRSTPRSPPAAIRARWPACRSRSRTTSAPAASRPRARRGSSRVGSRRTTRRWSSGCAPPAR